MSLTIGDVAKQAGVGVETIRFTSGKVSSTGRAGRRPAFGTTTTRCHAASASSGTRRRLGFSLREIRELLDLRIDPNVSCADVKAKAVAKIAEVEDKLVSLTRMRDTLLAITRSCTR